MIQWTTSKDNTLMMKWTANNQQDGPFGKNVTMPAQDVMSSIVKEVRMIAPLMLNDLVVIS